MRITFVTQDYPPKSGGIETYSYELCKRLNKVCDHVTVFAPEKPGSEIVDNKAAFKTVRLKIPDTLLFLSLLPIFPIYTHQNDVNISFHAQWQTLLPAIVAKKLGVINHIAVAAHARELLLEPFKISLFNEWYEYYKRKLLSQVDIFFPVSEYTAGLLTNAGVKPDKIKVVINGTDPQNFYPKESKDLRNILNLEGKKIILTITRLVNRKGVDTVLKALPSVISKVNDIHYLIAGTGPEEKKLKSLVNELGLNEYVTFLGWLDNDQLNNYYNLCDIFVMPSKTIPPDVEGFGIVFLEANACKKPVIGSDSGGIPSAIIHNVTGLIIPEQNESELAKALIYLINNKEESDRLAQQGYNRVHEVANWDTSAGQIYNYLQKLMRET